MTNVHTLAGRRGMAIVLIAPLALLAGFALHPWIGAGLPDQSAIAAAAADHTSRWGVAHLAIAASSGLLAVAFLTIHHWLAETRRDGRTGQAISLIVLGSVLYALLPGMEMAPLAAAEAGVNVESVAAELVPWFIPVHVLGGFLFAVGVLRFRSEIAESGLLEGRLARVVAGALVALAVTRLVPITLVNFYVQSLAGIVALWPLALTMRNAATPATPAPRRITGIV